MVEYLAATAFAIRCTAYTTLGDSQAQLLVYDRVMIIPIIQYTKADWAMITLKKQERIDRSNRRESSVVILNTRRETWYFLTSHYSYPSRRCQGQDHT